MSRRQRRVAVADAGSVPERLRHFRFDDWLSAEELADLVVTTTGMALPRHWYRAYMGYAAARAEWCRVRGLKPYEIRKFFPARVAVDGQAGPGGRRGRR